MAALAFDIAAAAAAGVARAEDRCDAPLVDWLPRTAVERAVTDRGWTMETLRSEGGCYLVSARTRGGARISAAFLPHTLELLSVEGDVTPAPVKTAGEGG